MATFKQRTDSVRRRLKPSVTNVPSNVLNKWMGYSNVVLANVAKKGKVSLQRKVAQAILAERRTKK